MYAVFVTADPSPKALNRALLLIQDFEFGQYPEDSEWTLLTSKTLPSTAPGATTLPTPDISGNNDFVSQSLAEINTFIRANEAALERIDVSTGDWLIIDQKGLETSTCLVCEQVYYSGEDGQEGEEGLSSDFRACRLPYEEAHGMIVNLNLANMDFEEFVDEDAGEQPDGAWKWQSFDPSEGAPEGMAEEDIEREKALQELRNGGYAD
ncbi:hypothetical protein B0H14DRAFT_2868963 [Mycena olivaceomarginata]|uniref:DUF6924 domain-containing protein n=1 Tax=Mycena albidolilacea TaxID=1033008 RepID=A0AAD7A6D2_9AGAR|nr:hypothetical protein DFH08DRAFT_863300 [Mycena albidolilacea]KAJ7808741.1 hypothetical protein B0H14DRAFT_2868963 [Mycena olivaceomarginata]